jgi:hypothetical protein
MILDELRRIGDALASRAQEYGYGSASLADLVCESLRSETWWRDVDIEDLYNEILGCESLPPQHIPSGIFGDPPVIVHLSDDHKFYIELLFHFKMSMDIHDHGFTGAFVVLSGECANQIYNFESEEPLPVSSGTLDRRHTERLQVGDVRPIPNGRQFIHRNLHLDEPTVTLVARTASDNVTQHTYYAPGLSVESGVTGVERRQLELIQSLLRTDIDKARPYLEYLIDRNIRSNQAYRILDLMSKSGFPGSYLADVLDRASPKFGAFTDVVWKSLNMTENLDVELARILLERRPPE